MELTGLKHTPPWDWPQDASETLLKVLRGPTEAETDCLLAAEMAAEYSVINDELCEVLLSILGTGGASTALRARAALSLGPVLEGADTYGFDDPDDVPIRETTFRLVKDGLRRLYTDASVPKEVRRRVLEASVRAPQAWHPPAIRAAYASRDSDWELTAVFAMRWIRGFDDQILEALNSKDAQIHYEAVCAAGVMELDSAWPILTAIITRETVDKALLLAAIDATAAIRPKEAGALLVDLTESDDEDVVAAAHEAMAMAEGRQALEE